MRRPFAVLALAALLGTAAPLPADEVPHLDFVRGLRERHYPDLALEYLDKLRLGNPPAAVAAVLPLEYAKVHLDLATAEAEGSRRFDLYNKARTEFQEFIDKNPDNPLVADARLEVARVTILQGKTQLSRALMQQDADAREKDALVARQTFVQANAQLKAVAELLDKQVEKLPDPKTPEEKSQKRALEQARLQAQLDLGLNFIDQAQTYLDNGNLAVGLERSKIVAQAFPVLEKVAGAADQKSPVAWQARAWVGYWYHQNGEPNKALDKLKEVSAQTDPAAAPGKRLAVLFQIKVLLDPPAQDNPANVAQARKDAEAWLADYRGFVNTPEGCGVRYYLADILMRTGVGLKDKVARSQQLARAHNLCRDLTAFDNDYSEKARVLGVKITGVEGGFEKDIAKLATFEDCLVRAEYEAVKSDEFARSKEATPEAIEKERRTRIANAIEALRLGLELAAKPGAKVPPAEVGKARSMLCGYYLFTNRYKEAITAGEDAARAVPPTAQSARTAMYVLEAYNDLINAGLRDGITLAEFSQKEDGKPSVIDRMNDLALMMEQRWPNEPAGDLARHMRGLLLIKQKKEPEAIAILSQVSPNYPAGIFVKYQLAMTAFQAAQDRNALAKAEADKSRKDQLAKEEERFNKLALDALKAMPALPPGADPLTTGVYLQGKIELARAFYRARQYADIDKLIDPLLDGLKTGQLKLDSKEHQEDAAGNLRLLQLYSKYGAAENAAEAGKAAEVKTITDPIVAEIRKGGYPELKKNPALRWGLMGLALRVSIQQGNTAGGLEILDAAQKFATDDGGDAASKAIFIQVALMVKDQMREVRKKKDADLLKKTADNFNTFLDKLSEGKKGADFLRILAEAYGSVDNHDKAVEMARQVPEPKDDDAKDDKKVGNYHFCRLFIVKHLRLAGKVKEAIAELEEIRKTPWGKDHPETIKETNHLIAAQGAPGKAYSEWSKLVGQLSQKIQQPGMKDQYFECYYYMCDSRLQYAKALQDPKKRDDEIKRVAGYVVKLEGPWPDLGGEESKARFSDLLDREPALKEQYETLKGDKK